LFYGNRGFPGGSSLAKLLEEQRGVRNSRRPPKLSIPQILEWADTHHARTGQWPSARSGAVAQSPGDSWSAIEVALSHGCRGLPSRLSIIRLLSKHRGAYNQMNPPPLTITKILEWADAHYEQTGDWPSRDSGPVLGVPHEDWGRINNTLKYGRRGLR